MTRKLARIRRQASASLEGKTSLYFDFDMVRANSQKEVRFYGGLTLFTEGTYMLSGLMVYHGGSWELRGRLKLEAGGGRELTSLLEKAFQHLLESDQGSVKRIINRHSPWPPPR